MGYLKAAIGTTLLFILALFAFIFFAFNTDYKLSKAEEFFLKDQLKEAGEILTQLEGKVEEQKLSLCKAYIARAGNNISLSNQLLSCALAQSKSSGKNPCDKNFEIYLNQLLNAAITQDYNTIHELLHLISSFDSRNEYVRQFTALDMCARGEYLQALEIWSHPGERAALSGWMKKSFDSVLSTEWKALLTARCEIETGNAFEGRKIVELHSESFTGPQIAIGNFLIGWSCIIESAALVQTEALHCFKLGLSYLKKVPLHDPCYEKLADDILGRVRSTASALFEEENFDELPIFIDAFSSWQQLAEIEALQKRFLEAAANSLVSNDYHKLLKLALASRKIFPNASVHATILSSVEASLFQALQAKNDKTMMQLWDLAQSCASDPSAYTAYLSEKTHDRILSLIEEDNAELKQTSPYIDFLQVIQNDHQSRYDFAQELVSLSGSLWLKDGDEQKAFKLMKIAADLPFLSDKKMLQDHLEKSLKIVYRSAVAQDRINRLSALMEAFRYFQIKSDQLIDKKEIANQLADAKYLYQHKRYCDTLKKTSLILSVDPQNNEALRLSGLSKYYLGDYSEALNILKTAAGQSSEIQEVLGVCQILSDQKTLGLKTLENLYKNNQIGKQTCIDIGFALIMQDDGENAKKWLSRVSHPKDGVQAGLCYAAFLKSDWDEALEHYRKLAAPYNSLKGLQIIAARALAFQNQTELADEMFQKALKNNSQAPLEHLTAIFKNFIECKLNKFDTLMVYGDFQADCKGDFVKALECYNLASSALEEEVAYKKGLAYKGLREFTLAEGLLKNVAEGQSIFKSPAKYALAQLHLEAKLPSLACNWFEAFYDESANELTGRSNYARALSDMHLWPDSLSQLRKLSQAEGSLPENRLLLIQNLYAQGSFAQALKEIGQWTDEKTEIPLQVRLELAQICQDIGSENSSLCPLETLDGQESLSPEDLMALFKYYLAKGCDDNCQRIYDHCRPQMEASEEGLTLLEKWNERLGKSDACRQYAETLAAFENYGSEAEDILKKYPSFTPLHERRLFILQKLHQTHPNELSLLFRYCDACLYTAEHPNFNVGEDQAAFVLKLLNNISEKYLHLPQVYALKARCRILNKEIEAAKDDLQEACRLDSSDWKSAERLASLYEKCGDIPKAIAYLEKALRYRSDNIDCWVKLSKLYILEEDPISAKNCLQTASNKRPNDQKLYKDLAKLLTQLHRHEGAKAALKRALALDPADKETLVLLLHCLYHESVDKRIAEDPDVINDREQVYNQLKAIDSNLADRLLFEVSSKSLR